MVKVRDREQLFIDIVVYTILILFSVLCLLPFLNLIAVSFSTEIHVLAGEVSIWPIGFSLGAMKYVFYSDVFQSALIMSILTTAVFTVFALFLTILTAYPLSRNYLRGRRFFSLFIVFTMLFSGGLIPTYLVVNYLHLLNTFWAMIIPSVINAFNLIIMISFFRGIPAEFEESAKIDGASNIRTLISIILPLSMPVLATITLFYAVQRWNGWFDILMYISDDRLNTLQIVLKRLITSSTSSIFKSHVPNAQPLLSVQGAAVIFTMFPILLFYPFLQKYFIKGALIGGIKG